uniref:Dynein light chain n=1 Tax=Acrobeloides nanus TaxID=290746 RepID=A0A914DW92_9BILA
MDASTSSGSGSSSSNSSKRYSGSFKRSFTHPLIRNCDMEEPMKNFMIGLITKSCDQHKNNYMKTAKEITKRLIRKYNSAWNVVVGEEFGFQIDHDPNRVLYMFYGTSTAICVWQST